MHPRGSENTTRYAARLQHSHGNAVLRTKSPGAKFSFVKDNSRRPLGPSCSGRGFQRVDSRPDNADAFGEIRKPEPRTAHREAAQLSWIPSAPASRSHLLRTAAAHRKGGVDPH